MPSYHYVAINASGDTIKGKLIAINEVDLEERVKSLSLDLVRYKMVRTSRFSLGGKIRVKDLVLLCVHMEQLGRAGVPLFDSIADLRDSTDSPRLMELLSDIYENVKGGTMLSDAMAKHPRVFDHVFVGLIKAGEKTGQLSESFHHLGNHVKWNDELRRKIKKAIRYPIALLFMMVGVITVMMISVVPPLSDFLTTQGFDLPLHTRALIATSHIFVEYWYLLFGIPIFLLLLARVFYRISSSFAYKVDGLILKLPLIGEVVLKSNLSRFTHFFSVTFISGIEILECLDTAQNVVGNLVVKAALKDVRKSVSEGNSLTLALTSVNKFPSLVVRIFKVGEESGNMEEALKNVNYFYDREVNDSVEMIVGFIQPALTIMMGLIMLWITAAVFGPLYDSFSKMEF